MFQTKVIEKIKTYFVVNIFFPPKNLTVYEIVGKNTVEQGWPQMTI